jgi:hypothetical protein
MGHVRMRENRSPRPTGSCGVERLAALTSSLLDFVRSCYAADLRCPGDGPVVAKVGKSRLRLPYMSSKITRFTSALCLAFTPLGCGSSQKFPVEPPRQAEEGPTAPEAIIAQLTEYVKRGAVHLTDTHYAVLFDSGRDRGIARANAFPSANLHQRTYL